MPATMMLIVLVGPKIRCREDDSNAQTAPPTIAHASTAGTGRPATSAKPTACGIVVSATVAPATRSARNFFRL